MSTVFGLIKRTAPLCLLVLVCAYSQAQVMQTARTEFPLLAEDKEKFKAVNLDEDGLMLYRRAFGKTDDQIELIRMDTSLRETWRGNINIVKELTLALVRRSGDNIFMLLRQRNVIGGGFVIVALRTTNGTFTTYAVSNLIPFIPNEFEVTPQAALIGGYFNYRPIVVHFNFGTRQAKVLPGFFNEIGELDQMKTYADGSSDIVVCAKNFEKKKSLWIRNYDAQGDLLKTTVLEPEANKNLIFGRSVKLPNGDQVVAGVYGRFSDYSRGIFVAGINPMGEYAIRYYNFAELKNFFSYMKAKRQKRVQDRIERRTIRGKKIKFNYKLLIHDIIPYKNQYIMTGEAFYPKYIYPAGYHPANRSRIFYPSYAGLYNAPNQRGDLIFDGYQYTHAVVVGFDPNGKIKWDNSFEINDVKSFQLEQFVKIKPEEDRILMMYLFENSLRSKIIRDSNVIEGKSQGEMRPSAGSEELDTKGVENEQLDYWYGKYFYAYGVQKLRNKNITGATRKIFFVNKIAYN